MTIQKSRLVNMLNNNTSLNSKTFLVKKTQTILKHIDVLYREGIVLSFSIRNNTVVIVTNTSNYFFVNDKISLLTKKKSKNNKKYKDLTKYSCGLQNLYLSTSEGVLPLKKTKLKFLGGYPFILV